MEYKNESPQKDFKMVFAFLFKFSADVTAGRQNHESALCSLEIIGLLQSERRGGAGEEKTLSGRAWGDRGLLSKAASAAPLCVRPWTPSLFFQRQKIPFWRTANPRTTKSKN